MKRMLTALLCLALALSACAAPAAPPEAEPLEWLFPPLEDSSCGAASETGFYEVLPRDASGMASPGYNLCFTDFATLTRVPVCADPGCAHDSEACTGWLAENTSVAVWNGQLILGNLDGSGFQWLDCMEPDGSNRHRLITLPANLSLLESVGASGQAFYGVGVSVDPNDPEAKPSAGLYRLDPATGQIAELPLPGENRVGEAVPYPLLAEWDSQFLVETGTRRIDSHLAVISKEDFWAGKAAYTPITDAR